MVHTVIWILIKAFRVTLKGVHEPPPLKKKSPWFAKRKILKKGWQRGGRCVDLKWLGGYTKKYEFHLRNSSYGFVSCYIWLEQTFGNVAPPFFKIFIFAKYGISEFTRIKNQLHTTITYWNMIFEAKRSTFFQ